MGVREREGRRMQESMRSEREGKEEGMRPLCINNLETVHLNALSNVYVQHHLEGRRAAKVSLLLQYRVYYLVSTSTGTIRSNCTHTHTHT